ISVSISGILILPDVFIRTIAQIGHDEAECRVLRANAYATIREINAISKSKTASPKLFDTIKLDEVGYSSDNGLGDKPVFDRTYLIDYEAKTGGAFMSIADYEKTVARIAYMQLFPPLFGNTNSMEDTIYKRFQIANDPLYGSCGTAKAKYPADSVLKYCSLRAAKDTLFAGWQRIDERISARQRKEAEHEENSSAVKKCINPRAEYVRMFDELSSKTSDEIDQNRLFVNIAADVSNEKYVPKDDGTEIIESNDKVEDFITTLQGLIDKDISNVYPGNISQLKIQQDCEAWVESDACSKGDDLKVFVANQAKMVQRFLADINYRLEEIAENVVNIVCPNDMGDVDEANLASIKGMFTKTDENGESYFIHPIAVRYILYKLADLLEGYKNESIVDEAREAVIKGPEMTLDNKKTTIVTRITLPEFIEDKPFFISKKKHIKNVKRVYYDYNSQYTDLCSDFAKKLVMQKVAMLLAQRIEVLTKVVENFFGNLDQVYDKLNNDIAANIEENNENANKIFYVFASGEEKEYLYESLNLDTGNSDKSINKTIVDAFYAQFCVKDNQIARNNIKYEKQSVIATFFTELLNTYGDIIKNDCNDKIDLDLYTAVCKSSDFEYKRENGDAEEDSNSRAKRHMKAMKDWVARVQSNSSPYLLVKDDIKSNPSKQTTFWGFSPDLAKACPELGQILGVNTETQQNKAYDKCELDCYRAVYGIEAGEVDKFNEERKQERDNYYGSYEYIVSTMDEKVANGDEEALVMTPHLDKTWHKILPFISPDKKD
ncbi:MAG: hypothetical protein IJ039_10045, partial [Clostridia bacterium]|nr:hypothetical protein [Clostridia bacterium]